MFDCSVEFCPKFSRFLSIDDAPTYVNGQQLSEETVLHHVSYILFESAFYR